MAETRRKFDRDFREGAVRAGPGDGSADRAGGPGPGINEGTQSMAPRRLHHRRHRTRADGTIRARQQRHPHLGKPRTNTSLSQCHQGHHVRHMAKRSPRSWR